MKREVKDIRPVAKEWGYNESEIDGFLAHLNVKGYIEHSGVGDAYTLYESLLRASGMLGHKPIVFFFRILDFSRELSNRHRTFPAGC